MNKILVEQNKELFHVVCDYSEDVKALNYNEIQDYEDLEDFLNQIVDSVVATTGNKTDISITLTDNMGVFIWSIIVSFDSEFLNYRFVNWEEADTTYQYGG